MIGPLIVKATGGADHTSRRDDKITAVNEVRELRVHTGVTVPGQNCGEEEKERKEEADMNVLRRRGQMGGRWRTNLQIFVCVRVTLQQGGSRCDALRYVVSGVDGVEELWRAVIFICYVDDHLQGAYHIQ